MWACEQPLSWSRCAPCQYVECAGSTYSAAPDQYIFPIRYNTGWLYKPFSLQILSNLTSPIKLIWQPFRFDMESLIWNYFIVKAAFKSCFGLNCLSRSTSDATASDEGAQPVKEAVVAQLKTPSGSKSNGISHREHTNGRAQPLDVAPDDTVRPPVSKDYGLMRPGETSPPPKPVDQFISPPSNEGSLLVEPESVGSGGDRRDEPCAREPRRKALLVGTLIYSLTFQ